MLYYQENAGRVQAIEPVVSLKKDFGDQRVLAGTFTTDSLSGATPNGAPPPPAADLCQSLEQESSGPGAGQQDGALHDRSG